MPPLTNHTSANIPAVVMNCALHSGKLNICHGNTQSLCARKFAKLDEVKDLLHNSKVTVACFTESWLTVQISDRCIAIPGFAVCRNDRMYQRGGGIVIYYRSHLSCRKVFCTQLSAESGNKTESLVVELRFGVGCPALSQHDLIFASLDFDANPVPRVNTYRDYVNFDSTSLVDAVSSVPWHNFYEVNDPNELADFSTPG
ncbi:hypothetical protein quinque_008954 [Culex quinquefasciatus]